MPDQEIPPVSELYKVTRGQIEHYDNAINSRVIWLSIGQSFFFNVYAMLVTAKAPTPELMNKQKMLALIFPVAALIVAVFTFVDVLAGLVYLRKLRLNYKAATNGSSEEQPYPMINGNKFDRSFQRVSPVVISLVFILTWAYLLLYDHKVL